MEDKLSSGNVHQFNGTTLFELKTEINNVESGDTIVLNNDIAWESTYIQISKKIYNQQVKSIKIQKMSYKKRKKYLINLNH